MGAPNNPYDASTWGGTATYQIPTVGTGNPLDPFSPNYKPKHPIRIVPTTKVKGKPKKAQPYTFTASLLDPGLGVKGKLGIRPDAAAGLDAFLKLPPPWVPPPSVFDTTQIPPPQQVAFTPTQITGPSGVTPPNPLANSGTATQGDYATLIKQIDALNKSKLPNNIRAAQILAGQVLGPQIAALRTQQSQYEDQGHNQALNILAASRAAANLNTSDAQTIGNQYLHAADELKAIAGGYAGNVQDLATQDANAVKAGVESQHAAYTPGQVGGTDLASLPQNAYNAIYGLQGAIPANSLTNQSAAAMRIAQTYPSLLRGAGEQGALLAQGAADQKAQALNADVGNIAAKLPALVNQYLTSLNSQDMNVRKQALAALNTTLGAVKAGDTSNREWASLSDTSNRGWQSLTDTSNRAWQSLNDTSNRGWQSLANSLNFHNQELTIREKAMLLSLDRQNAENSYHGKLLSQADQRLWIQKYKLIHPTAGKSSSSAKTHADSQNSRVNSGVHTIVHGEPGQMSQGQLTYLVPPVTDLLQAVQQLQGLYPKLTYKQAVAKLTTQSNYVRTPDEIAAWKNGDQNVRPPSFAEQWQTAQHSADVANAKKLAGIG